MGEGVGWWDRMGGWVDTISVETAFCAVICVLCRALANVLRREGL